MSEEKKKYSLKDYKEQIEQIKAVNISLIAIVQTMPTCTARKAFELSIKNISRKLEVYGKEYVSEKLTDEEKELIKKFREGKMSSIETKKDEVSTNDDISDDKKTFKNKIKKH